MRRLVGKVRIQRYVVSRHSSDPHRTCSFLFPPYVGTTRTRPWPYGPRAAPSLIRPAKTFASALVIPNVTMNDRTAVRECQQKVMLGEQRQHGSLQANHRHVSNILDKIGFASRGQATARAVEQEISTTLG